MRTEKHYWISLVVIAVISSQRSAQAQLQNTTKNQGNETVQGIQTFKTENITKLFDISSNSPKIIFEFILANSMKNFIPYSHVNKNCVRDGLHYITGLNNQTRWAVQSELNMK